VAENDVDVARGVVEGDRARIRALEENEKAAKAVVQSQVQNERATREAANSVRDIESYLRITAPFDGVVTERNVDKGSLAGPSSWFIILADATATTDIALTPGHIGS
jgi:multidrug resistance efflux pump